MWKPWRAWPARPGRRLPGRSWRTACGGECQGRRACLLKSRSIGTVGPGLDTQDVGPDRLPHVDESVTRDLHIVAVSGMAHLGGNPGLLRVRHEMVDEDAEALAPGPVRTPRRSPAGHPCRPCTLDHHADVAQVVTPDLLHQLGIVASLHIDARTQRHMGLLVAVGARTGGGAQRLACTASRRDAQRYGTPSTR